MEVYDCKKDSKEESNLGAGGFWRGLVKEGGGLRTMRVTRRRGVEDATVLLEAEGSRVIARLGVDCTDFPAAGRLPRLLTGDEALSVGGGDSAASSLLGAGETGVSSLRFFAGGISSGGPIAARRRC